MSSLQYHQYNQQMVTIKLFLCYIFIIHVFSQKKCSILSKRCLTSVIEIISSFNEGCIGRRCSVHQIQFGPLRLLTFSKSHCGGVNGSPISVDKRIQEQRINCMQTDFLLFNLLQMSLSLKETYLVLLLSRNKIYETRK